MNLFRSFFGLRSPAPADTSQPTGRREIVRDRGEANGFVTIHSLNFFGVYSLSPNGRYRLAWRDSNDEGTRGGAREDGEGRYLLLDDDVLVAEGRMQRPTHGKVANNGTFILNDWRFTSGLSGILCAFRADGSSILSRQFSANLFNNGLADDGSFAACQTCNAPSSDGNLLSIFDLSSAQVVTEFAAETGWPDGYEFRPAERVIRLADREGGSYAYSFDGQFLERDHWIKTGLDRGDVMMVRMVIEEAAGKLDHKVAHELLASLSIAAVHHNYRDAGWQATIERLRGECFEALDDPTDAITAYEKAIELDTKIGVKRRLAQLRKSVGA